MPTELLPDQISRKAPPPEVEQSVEARNAWLERSINPDGTLPRVTLDPIPMDPGSYAVSSPAYQPYGDEPFGSITLRQPDWDDTHVTVSSVQLHVGSARKQFGPALYLEVMKGLSLGQGLQSGDSLTEGSYQLWRRLEACGIAVCDTAPTDAIPNKDGNYLNVRFRTVFGQAATSSPEQPAVSPGRTDRMTRLLRRLRP